MIIDTTLWNYFANASIIVKGVMLILMIASILSWTYILERTLFLKNMKNQTAQFETKFWLGGDLSKLAADSNTHKKEWQGTEAIFQAGFKEFMRLHKSNLATDAILENVRRAMRGAEIREQDNMELHLPVLATVGSMSPYVGLFGTVCGIMLSFRALATVQQATISMVAPGIAEALIATALGLFAAIPAVVAYNRFTTEINRLLNRFYVFQEEFSNILYRQAQTNLTRRDVNTPSMESYT